MHTYLKSSPFVSVLLTCFLALSSTTFAKGGGGGGGGGSRGGGGGGGSRGGGGGGGGGSRGGGGGGGGGGGARTTGGSGGTRATGGGTRTTGGSSGVSFKPARTKTTSSSNSGGMTSSIKPRNNFNFKKVTPAEPYKRFNSAAPVSGAPATPAQAKVAQRSEGISRILNQRSSSYASASPSLGSRLLDAYINPLNPYFWLIHHNSIFGHRQNVYVTQAPTYVANGSGNGTFEPVLGSQSSAPQNIMINDKIINEVGLMDECLANASKYSIDKRYCTDASYDLKLEFTAITSKDAISAWWNPFNPSYDLKLTTNPADPAALIAKTTKKYEADSLIKDRLLLVLNVNSMEFIASLDKNATPSVQIGDDKVDSALLDIKKIMMNFNQYNIYNVNNKFTVRAIATKILPANIQLNEGLAQQIGTDVDDIQNCARYMAKLGQDTSLCLKTFQSTTDSGQDISVLGLSYVLTDGKNGVLTADSSGTVINVEEKKPFAEIIGDFYPNFYNRNVAQKTLAIKSFASEYPACTLEYAKIATGSNQVCGLPTFHLTTALKDLRVNVFQKAAEELVSGVQPENFTPENMKDLAKFTNAQQVSVLKVYLATDKFYPELISELIAYPPTIEKLEAIEEVVTKSPEQLQKYSIQIMQ